MKSFLEYVSERQLDFYLEQVENYNDFMKFRSGKGRCPTCVGKRSESEYKLLENKTLFKFLNHKNWSVEEISEELIAEASNWETEIIKNG